MELLYIRELHNTKLCNLSRLNMLINIHPTPPPTVPPPPTHFFGVGIEGQCTLASVMIQWLPYKCGRSFTPWQQPRHHRLNSSQNSHWSEVQNLQPTT